MRARDAVLVTIGVLVLAAAGTAAVLALRPAPLPPAHQAAARSPKPSPPASPVAVLDAGSYTGTKPWGLFMSGDGSSFISDIVWSTWTATEAVGTGSSNVDNCQPNCAQGTFSVTPITITLSEPAGGVFGTMVTNDSGVIKEYHYSTVSSSDTGLPWPLGAQQTKPASG